MIRAAGFCRGADNVKEISVKEISLRAIGVPTSPVPITPIFTRPILRAVWLASLGYAPLAWSLGANARSTAVRIAAVVVPPCRLSLGGGPNPLG